MVDDLISYDMARWSVKESDRLVPGDAIDIADREQP